LCEIHQELIKHVGHIVQHLDLGNARDWEIKSHAKVIIDLSTNAFDDATVAILD